MQEELGCVVVHTVVLVVENCDASMYEVLLPLYFPRSLQEERTAVLRLPVDNNDDYTENDRRIRIIDNPQHYTHTPYGKYLDTYLYILCVYMLPPLFKLRQFIEGLGRRYL